MSCEMLGGDLAESLIADWTHSLPVFPICDTNVVESLSQELAA
jgi:hypothetical protein